MFWYLFICIYSFTISKDIIEKQSAKDFIKILYFGKLKINEKVSKIQTFLASFNFIWLIKIQICKFNERKGNYTQPTTHFFSPEIICGKYKTKIIKSNIFFHFFFFFFQTQKNVIY